MKHIDIAKGGTLLLDEAYQLSPPDSSREFGPEAMATITTCYRTYIPIYFLPNLYDKYQ